LVAEAAQADLAEFLASCVGACVLVIVIVEIPGVVRRRVEAWQAAIYAEVAARLRMERKSQGRSPEVVQSGAPGARAEEIGELRALADAGRVLRVRLGDRVNSEALLADGLATAVASWEQRARWALRGHHVESAACRGAAGQDCFAVTVGGARDRVTAQVRELLTVAGELDSNRILGPGGSGRLM